MTPMCLDTTGEQAGWAIAVSTCDGAVSLNYYDVDGADLGGDLPTNWMPCTQGLPGPEWAPTHTTTTYASSINIDMAGAEYVSVPNITGNLTVTATNYSSAREIIARFVETGGSSRTLTWPVGWVWVGSAAPTSIAANKTGKLTLVSFGTSASSVVARWEVQV